MTLNASDTSNDAILYYILNGYGVTLIYLIINIITAILAVWIILLNSLVIQTIFTQRLQAEPADFFVLSLATADLFTGILLSYNTVYNMINYFNIQECRFRFGLFIVVVVCTGIHLMLLAADRYIRITKPLHYHSFFTKKSVTISCGCIWIFSVVIGSLPTIGWSKSTLQEESVCSFFGTMPYGYLVLITVIFWTPILTMIALYVHIFIIAHKHAMSIYQQETITHHASQQRKFERQSWKFTKTISIIIGLYLVMWVPTGVVIFIDIDNGFSHLTNSEKGEILLYVTSLAFLNSLMDPIIYAFKISCVKMKFRRVFRLCHRKQRITMTAINNDPQSRLTAVSGWV